MSKNVDLGYSEIPSPRYEIGQWLFWVFASKEISKEYCGRVCGRFYSQMESRSPYWEYGLENIICDPLGFSLPLPGVEVMPEDELFLTSQRVLLPPYQVVA